MLKQILYPELQIICGADLPWERLHGCSVLVTGAAGMIPSYLALTLACYRDMNPACEITLTLLARNQVKLQKYYKGYTQNPWLNILIGDVCSFPFEEQKYDYIIHGASPADPYHFGHDPAGTFLANTQGTHLLLELARKSYCKGFIFLSSGEVYGQLPDEVTQIDGEVFGSLDPMNLRSCYGEGKRAGETLCSIYAKQYGIPAKVIRISHTYGPTLDLEYDSRAFAEFIRSVIYNKNLEMKSDGTAIRPYCYLSDATDGIFRVLLQGKAGLAYQIAGEEYLSIRELAELLCSLYPQKNLIIEQKSRSKEDCYLTAKTQAPKKVNTERLKNLGWTIQTDVRTGFFKTINTLEALYG